MEYHEAITRTLELADQNAILVEEVHNDEAAGSEFEKQQHAFEIVQDYLDSDLGESMCRYTKQEIIDALSMVAEMALENLDEDKGSEDYIIQERACFRTNIHIVRMIRGGV